MKTLLWKLEDMPHVSPRIADDFRKLGILYPKDLKQKETLELYKALQKEPGSVRTAGRSTLRSVLFFLSLVFISSLVSADSFEVKEHGFIRNGEKFLVKGVVYVPVYPGEVPWELARKKDLPLTLKRQIVRDLKDIKKMGANTLRFWDVPEFAYQALKDEKDLALIQTIWFDSQKKDLQNPSYKEQCRQAIRLTLKRLYTVYSREDPPPILTFIVGSELSRASIQRTDELHPERDGYQGEFISAPKGSSASESFIAEMADYLKTYEKEHFGQVHFVSYANEIRTYDLLDTPFLDFRSVNLYTNSILDFSSPENGSVTGTVFQGWLEAMKMKHPEKPLLVTETGLSVAPEAPHQGPPEYGYGGNTPEEQAEALFQSWQDIKTASPPIAGMVVHEYLDAWWKFGKQDSLEHNRDDVEEWFGLAEIEKQGDFFTTRFRPAYQKLQKSWSQNNGPVPQVQAMRMEN